MNGPQLTPTEQAYVRAAAAGDVIPSLRLEQQVDAEAAAREAKLQRPEALLNAALWYAANIGPVFPTCPRGPGNTKQPLTLHGFKDATRNPATIREWWNKWPTANIGLPTGYRFDVIDVDGIPGYESVAKLREQGLLPEALARASTPRGTHYYIPPSGAGNTTAIMPGIDYRGKGGYVLAPPSNLDDNVEQHILAGSYRWLQPLHPAQLPTGN